MLIQNALDMIAELTAKSEPVYILFDELGGSRNVMFPITAQMVDKFSSAIKSSKNDCLRVEYSHINNSSHCFEFSTLPLQ